MTRNTSRTPSFRPSLLAAAVLLAASTSSFAATSYDHAALYAGGEAAPPEVEARVMAEMYPPQSALSRDEVMQDLADARRAGTLSAAGEIADTADVLTARSRFSEQQTLEILAAHEAQRQRVAALEAEAQARALAQAQAQLHAQAQAQAQPLDPDSPLAPASEVAALAAAMAVDVNGNPIIDETAEGPTDDEPAPVPVAPHALPPIEVPISRPSDLPPQILIDKD
jgi:hypothetical protein